MTTTQIDFYNKRIERSEIDDELRKHMLDYFCNISDSFQHDWVRMKENYALKNNQLNRESYAAVCRGLGSDAQAQLYINAYNHTHNIIGQLVGDEWSRPFSYDILNTNPNVANKIDRKKRMEIESLVYKIFQIEVSKLEAFVSAEIDAAANNIPPEELEQAKQEIQDSYNKKYNDLPNIKSLMDKYENISTAEELTMSKIMKSLQKKYNIKHVKNRSFEDLLLTATEFIEVYQDRDGELPKIRDLNPLTVFYEKSHNTYEIEKGDYAGYKEYITSAQALSEYGDKLSKDSIEKLSSFNYKGGIRGLHHTMYNGETVPGSWQEENKYNRFVGGGYNTTTDFMIADDRYGAPDFGHVGRFYNSDIGLSTTDTYKNSLGQVAKYTVYWKMQRKLGVLKFINDDLEEDSIVVSEDFIVPKRATKKSEQVHNSFTKRTIYTWYDDNEKQYELYWIWVPEIWKGIRLGFDMYVECGPLKHAYQSMLNPYESKLPIHGTIINNRNAYPVSVMDRLKPWQEIYYVIMARFLKLLSQDKGIWSILNTHLFDKDLGPAATMQIAEDNATLFYNPLSNAKIGSQLALTNTMKAAERLDLSNSGLVNNYVQILSFIEENMMKVAGMSAQRMAQSNPRMTASDNSRENEFSFNMTESLFVAHDLLWSNVLQTMMEMSLDVLKNNSGLIRGLLNDDEKTLIDLNILTLEDNFVLQVGDNSKSFRIMEQAMQLSHALIQNDKADLAALIDMMRSESLTELRMKIKDAEMIAQKRMQEQQQSAQQHEKEIEEMRLKAMENDQISKLDIEYLRGLMALKKQELKSQYDNMSFDEQKDYNSDGIPDYMQMAQLQQRINNETAKNSLAKEKIDLEKAKTIDELDLKRSELEAKRDKNTQDKEDKEKDRAAKERLEKTKLKKLNNK